MNNSERLNALYKTYDLTPDDYFKHKHYTIITRSGIDKIQAKSNIIINYELVYHTNDCQTAIIKAVAKINRTQEGNSVSSYIETFGEVSPDNNKNSYPIAMAEKRAMSRAVLKLAGFYQLNVFGEYEEEDFKTSKPSKSTYADNLRNG